MSARPPATREGLECGRAFRFSAAGGAYAFHNHSVSSSGTVHATEPGSADVIAASGNHRDSATIVVVAQAPAAVASVTVSPSTASLLVGATAQLTATTKDSAGTVLTGRTVAWTSSDTTVARVSASGLVTGKAAGTATITATSEGKSGTASVTVARVPVASV